MTLGELALVNFKPFEARFYLFLVPILGAGAGVCIALIAAALPGRSARGLAALVLLLLSVHGLTGAARAARSSLHTQDTELGSAVPRVRQHVPTPCRMISRKPHIPFYARCDNVVIPIVDDLASLRGALEAYDDGRPTFLYFGPSETSRRPGIAALSDRTRAPGWLVPVAWAGGEAAWVLYRYAPA